MKVKFNIDESLQEEKAEFWLKKMTDKISRITKELNSKQDFLWCFKNGDAFPVNFSKIALIQVEEEKTKIYTADNIYLYKARLYQVKNLLPHEFIAVSRGAIINYHQLDHLQILNNGNIDAILPNKIRVQVSRRRIRDLKERLGL